jgi:hypothetical protein
MIKNELIPVKFSHPSYLPEPRTVTVLPAPVIVHPLITAPPIVPPVADRLHCAKA